MENESGFYEIENLEIVVESETDKAVKGLDKLHNMLEKLDNKVKNTGLGEFCNHLKTIASTDLSKTASDMERMATAQERIVKAQEKLAALKAKANDAVRSHTTALPKTTAKTSRSKPTSWLTGELTDVNRMGKALDKLADPARQKGLDDLRDRLRELATIDLGPLADDMERIAKTSKGINFEKMQRKVTETKPETPVTPPKLTSFAKDFPAFWEKAKIGAGAFLDKIKSLPGALRKLELDTIKEKVAAVDTEWNKTSDTMEKVKKKNNSMSFMKAIKTILLYNVLFSALNAVTSGITEGLENVTQASKEANAVMTEYKATTLQMKNAIGSAAIPVLKALYPHFLALSNIVIDTANAVNQLTSALQGKDTYLKAKADVDGYVDSLKKAKGLLGMDEINTMSKSTSYGDMFEETKIDGWSIASAIANVAALTSGVLLLRAALKGFTWADMAKGATGFFGIFKTGWKNVKTFTSSLPPLAKLLIGAGGVVYGFKLAADGGYDLAKALSSENKEGLGSAIASLVSGGAMAVVGGALIGGPVGALIGGLVAVGGALVGSAKAHKEYRLEMLDTAFYDVQGRALSEVKDDLNAYLDALGFDKQEEWKRKIEETTLAYENSAIAYDDMWKALGNKHTFDTAEIEKLSTVFSDLATAVTAVNNAHIDKLMSSIKTNIETNITPALTQQLGDLVTKIEDYQAVMGIQVSGLSAQYQQILNDIAANGGVVSDKQKADLSELRQKINTFTLTDNSDKKTWDVAMSDALDVKIRAGDDKEDILTNIEELMENRDLYLESLKEQYVHDADILEQLIDQDKNQFGGALGFTDHDMELLKATYDTNVFFVNKQFDDVLAKIIGTYSSVMLDSDYIKEYVKKSVDNDTFWGKLQHSFLDYKLPTYDENGYDTYEQGIVTEYTKNVNDFIEELSKYFFDPNFIGPFPTPAYATGGFPEDGLFLANHTELIGKFANGKTAVANNEQIIEGIARGVASASGEQNALLREQNRLLAEIAGKEAVAEVSVSTITRGLARQNRRAGRAVVNANG